MKHITKQEYENLLGTGIGVCSFMGGCKAEEGKETFYLVGDEILIPETEEDQVDIFKRQAQEAKDFMETCR
jgi:hypothetical protein